MKLSFRSMAATLLPIGALMGSAAVWQAAAQTTLEAVERPVVESHVYYRWIDEQGRIQFTDFEPIGVPSQRIEADPERASAVSDRSAPPLTAAGSGPAADPDQQILPIEHIGPCADARKQLVVLQSGLPVYVDQQDEYRNAWRGDAYQGERRYLTAARRQSAVSEARSAVLANCSDPAAFEAEVRAFREQVR